MKKAFLGLVLLFACLAPTITFAKGVPLFFQTGDELFEIDGAPIFDDGYSVGYACKRFGLFGADVWTWDCDLMAINVNEFSAGDLEEDFKAEMLATYSLSDRKRNLWNHYGVAAMGIFLVGVIGIKAKS